MDSFWCFPWTLSLTFLGFSLVSHGSSWIFKRFSPERYVFSSWHFMDSVQCVIELIFHSFSVLQIRSDILWIQFDFFCGFSWTLGGVG